MPRRKIDDCRCGSCGQRVPALFEEHVAAVRRLVEAVEAEKAHLYPNTHLLWRLADATRVLVDKIEGASR